VNVNRIYGDVPEAWPIRRSRERVDPDANLREEARRLGAEIVELEPEKEGAD
jgi:hypothetical protein